MNPKLIVFCAALFFVGCSSAQKPAEPSAPAKTATPAATHVTAPAAQARAATQTKSTLQCVGATDKRKLEVLPDGKGCKLQYEKMGKAETIATSVNGDAHCIAKLGQVESHLKAAGFKCE